MSLKTVNKNYSLLEFKYIFKFLIIYLKRVLKLTFIVSILELTFLSR